MNKKAECEAAVRRLCHDWAKEKGFTISSDIHPSFIEFKNWLGSNGYAHYLNFRSVAGADFDAEIWFDQELKQMWRR